jgi:hypothetical protein
MAIWHKKNFGIYHVDTFDNVAGLFDEAHTLKEAREKVMDKYGHKLGGADRVDIVDKNGTVKESYDVG